MYKLFFKRALDLMVTLIALIILLPLIIFTYIGLLIANNGRPLFFQTRTGLKGKLFKIYKFKTMNDRRDHRGELLSDHVRLTKIGKIVRKTSLDELPQLFNVLKGDMSLIGPRPLLPQYIPLYSEEQNKRHNVKPGITGWAQVNGRNSISWKSKFELDVWYVNNISFLLDLKIILFTIKKVIVSEGISSEGEVTAEVFNGKN